jgi:hypothetical protein
MAAAADDAVGATTGAWPQALATDEDEDSDVEDTLAGVVLSDEGLGAPVGSEGSPPEAAAEATGDGEGGPQTPDGGEPAGEAAAQAGLSGDAGSGQADDEAGFLNDEELRLLQRGVDLLNVSPVPKKISETSQSLGVPFVHVTGEADGTISATFMWALGWYRFAVSLEDAGSVRLADRGYEEREDLPPNGTVRSDGTVQLAPTFGKRPTPREETAADTEPSVSTASVTSGVIISKSLMGQRTDDEPVTPWEKQNARDFDWGR